MYKKILIILSVITSITCMSSCENKPKSQATDKSEMKIGNKVGNDRDNHGCIASAGYQWSELLKDCIRPFEKGIKMTSVIDSASTSAAYLVFNADSSKIEVYHPKLERHPILELITTKDGKSWVYNGKHSLSVKVIDGYFSLFENKTLHYKQVTK